MISLNDQIHLNELLNIYYPLYSSPDPNQSLEEQSLRLNTTTVNHSAECSITKESKKIPETGIPKYKTSFIRKHRCCNSFFSNHKQSVDHWIQYHHSPTIINTGTFITTQHGTLPSIKFSYDISCQNYSDLGNFDYPLFERASYFLRKIKHCPSNSAYFRPYSKIIDARLIHNPYSAALAIAYDFIQIVNTPTKEYHYFLFRLLQQDTKGSYPGGLQEHLPYWYFWYNYLYKNNSKLKLEKEFYFQKNKESYIDTLSYIPIEKSINRCLNQIGGKIKTTSAIEFSKKKNGIIKTSNNVKPKKCYFKCDTPGCNKKYKQISGLRYHKDQGKCLLVDKDKSKHIPFRCTFLPCKSSYNTVMGLKYHIRRHHLKSISFNQTDLIDPQHDFICPLGSRCRLSFNSIEKLRNHILECHLSLTDET